MVSKTSTTSSATTGVLSLMLVTLTVRVALSVFAPSAASTVSMWVVAVSKSSALPAAMARAPVAALIEKRPALLPLVMEYVMVFPSRSLSLLVWLSLRFRKDSLAFLFSATVADALAMAGALSLMLVTLTVMMALSVFVPSDA